MSEIESQSTRALPVTHVVNVNADHVWEQGYTGKNVVVAVLDSGTNEKHHDIKNNLWEGLKDIDGDGVDDIINGWNFIANNSVITDDYGHGTHCAGIVCGDGTSGQITGVAPDAKLMTVKIVGRTGSGTVNQMLSGVQFAVENGADILSMSLGFKNDQITTAQKELKAFFSLQEGITTLRIPVKILTIHTDFICNVKLSIYASLQCQHNSH